MKKIVLIACIAVAVSGCKKETLTTLAPNAGADYDKNNVEEVIRHADPALYNKVEAAFHPGAVRTTTDPIIVRFAHGIWTDKKWYCIPATCICFIEIISPKYVAGDALPPENEMKEITASISETYDHPEETFMIYMKSGEPHIHNISSMEAVVDKGQVAVDFEEVN